MPYQLWIADAARAAGLKVVEQKGWKTRGSKIFAPRAVLAHHVGSNSLAVSLDVVTNGRPDDLEGPLSQFVLGKDGTVYVIAAGKANHAGVGSWLDLEPQQLFGIEAVNKGDGTPWPQVQLDAYYKLAAALLKYMKQPAKHVLGHKEWAPTRKIDPKGIDMNDFRARVAKILAPPAPVPPTPQPIEEISMAVILQRQQGGYIVLQNRDGGIFAYDEAPFHGSLPSIGVTAKIVGGAWTPSGNGYWLLGEDGAIFGFGDGEYKGGFNTLDAATKGNRKPIGMVAKGNGYVIVAFDPDDNSPYDGYQFGT